ncbi:hypothetical protein [Microcoleus sp. FACHB-672]|uniref:hypothetical protein n=1 Tax=Microcoleus sp. FACHB-672 TaxID=2692825 RepID=UPI001689002A|nr:hypothetical protein [Microcoleus sp. FACHB-672]MBD2043569.1 hypothetical protein [Microcoleus sp. FACHB-672]
MSQAVAVPIEADKSTSLIQQPSGAKQREALILLSFCSEKGHRQPTLAYGPSSTGYPFTIKLARTDN